jgi:hypothetical protein
VIATEAGNESDLNQFKEILDTFWGDSSLNDYMDVRWVELNDTDPNSFVVLEWQPFGEDEHAQPYPFEVKSEEAIYYEYENKVLQYLVAMTGDEFTIYGQNETVKLEKAEIRSSDIQFDPKNLGVEVGKEKNVSGSRVYVATFLGAVMMFLIYFVIIIYGNMVMRSVMEEKTNRIVEIIISSVKPFELMLGKIIGVGAVGLTQFGIWAITIPTLNFIVSLFFAGRLQNANSLMQTAKVNPDEMENLTEIFQELWSFNYYPGIIL